MTYALPFIAIICCSDMLPKARDQPTEDLRGRSASRGGSRSPSVSPSGAATSSDGAATTSANRSASPGGSRTRQPGRPRTRSPSRPLSPARVQEQQLKAQALEGLFGMEEDLFLDGGAVTRFNTSYYIKGDGCEDFGFSR